MFVFWSLLIRDPEIYGDWGLAGNGISAGLVKLVDSDDIHYQAPGLFEETRFENIHNVIFTSQEVGSKAIAHEIAKIIKEKNAKGEKCVLGLATGSSPIKVYKELVRMHKEEGLSFKNVITFNLDEYYGLQKDNTESYWYFMHYHLFNHIDIDPKNVHIPDGTVPEDKVIEFCLNYDRQIREAGGLDFQLLGIGRTGHIGFNEPPSHKNSGTRMVTLNHLTRKDAAPAFHGIDNVPKRAITMGVGSVLGAKRIVIMAWGENKAPIVKKAIEGPVTSAIPASYLQNHGNTTFCLDEESASELTKIATPWLVGDIKWNEQMSVKAVFWLCEKLQKSILNLTAKDYKDNGLGALIADTTVEKYNDAIFTRLHKSITFYPGGEANNNHAPERPTPLKKRVIIFSPHPDDDVISMGGTFDRLVEQGHEVHVAYMTSGNIAVADEQALKYVEVFREMFGNQNLPKVTEAIDAIHNKKGEIDAEDVRMLKGNIRRHESLGATRYFNVPDNQVHFLNLPFYETGAIKKKPISDADIKIIMDLITSVKPHQIFAAGDLGDPHGTHKVCLDGIFAALRKMRALDFMKECWVWLYRGAWREWDMEEIEMSVPLTHEQVIRKRKAIFYHQTQKDGAPFLGEDPREFWQRAEYRNHDTAMRFKAFGMEEFEALEAFARYHF